MNFPDGKPICYLCGRQVDGLRAEQDEASRTTYYVAMCHGHEQVVELSEELIESAGRISFGLAFVPGSHPALPEPIPDEPPEEEPSCSTCHGPHDPEKHNTELHRLARTAGKI